MREETKSMALTAFNSRGPCAAKLDWALYIKLPVTWCMRTSHGHGHGHGHG
jgi:hypothetical protein